jgi:hypothetical protein
MSIHKTKYPIAISVGILVVVSTVALTKSNRTTPIPLKGHQETKQTIDIMPLIISQVKDIEVVKATLEDKGTDHPFAVLVIKNKSDKPVIAVSVEIGEPEEADGVTVNGFKEGDEPPSVIMEPNASVRALLSLNNAKPGEPIRVSAVVYADGSEEGEKTALETIHAQREHDKSEKAKGGSSPKLRSRTPLQ